MRTLVLESLLTIAKNDPDMILITGDLGFGLFEPFIETYPHQFLNLGIAEQNMIGVAAGLALSGKKVFIYSIGNFPSFRCLEQIRNDLCYHNLNVNIIAMGGGFSYGGLGMSHHATEDLSIMRALPNLTVVAPSNAQDAAQATHAVYKKQGPSYLRLEKTTIKYKSIEPFILSKARVISEGDNCCIMAIGGITHEAMIASTRLKNEKNINAKVVDFHTIKPFDTETCIQLLNSFNLIITVEENTIIGGLYSSVCEVSIAKSIQTRVLPIGIKDQYSSIVGDQGFLRRYYQLDSTAIFELISENI